MSTYGTRTGKAWTSDERHGKAPPADPEERTMAEVKRAAYRVGVQRYHAQKRAQAVENPPTFDDFEREEARRGRR